MNLINEKQLKDRLAQGIDLDLKRGFSNQYDNNQSPSISQMPYPSNILPGIAP